MTAAEQYQEFGISAEAHDDSVVIQVGKELVVLSPPDARRVMFYLARACCRAAQALVYRARAA